MFSLASAHEVIDEKSELKNPQLQKRLQDTISGFLTMVDKLK